jgi:cell division protein FtsB
LRPENSGAMPAKKARRRMRGSVARRWFAVGALVLVGLLYYRPLHDYFDARAQRAVRVAEVERLQKEQASLERRLRRASSPAALAREARALGYIRAGEHLFIVKDVPRWQKRRQAGNAASGGNGG